MLVIDDKGDPLFAMPHIFIDFSETNRPFVGTYANIVQYQRQPIHSSEFDHGYTKVKIFPDAFPEPKRGNTHELSALGLGERALNRLQFFRGSGVFYSFADKPVSLAQGDVIHLPERNGRGTDKHLEVTLVRKANVAAIATGENAEYQMQQLEDWAGRKVSPDESVTTYEVCEVYTWGKYLTYQDYREAWT
jgi:hypothetical protein